jgi:hypothetical protein
MKQLSLLSLVFFCACGSLTNKLEDKKQIITMRYIAWACDCANWVSQKDIAKYGNTDYLDKYCVYVEPATPELALPDSIGCSNDVVVFTGSFYKNKGFPKGYKSDEMPEKARVFRYTRFKIVQSNYREFTKPQK